MVQDHWPVGSEPQFVTTLSYSWTRRGMEGTQPSAAGGDGAATVMHRMIPVRGVLQEARVSQENATPIYIDSSSTTFVATNRAAPKKSTWVRRKSEELNECHELGESIPIKIDECDNFADPQTKYLTTKVWMRHLHYTHNMPGEPPPVHIKIKKKAVAFDEPKTI